MGQATRRAGYDTDFHAWTEDQARLLRAGRLEAADAANIAEELETLGRSERRGLQSSLRLIVLHILKLQHQPSRASRSWRVTIARERLAVEDILAESPSLIPQLPALFAKAYGEGRRLAAVETGLPGDTFPEAEAFTIAQLRDPAFLPTKSAKPG